MAIATSMNAARAERATADRWFYPFMAIVFLVVAAVAFAPSVSMMATDAVPELPLIWPVHGALMACWLLLFLAQALLMASGRRQLHMSLGLVSFALAPAIVITMSAITVRAVEFRLSLGQPQLAASDVFTAINTLLLFCVYYGWAIAVRRTAPETHKRMLVMACFVLVGAAVARMVWLPGLVGSSAVEALYHLLVLVPALAFDLFRLGRIHRAYWIGIGLYLPFVLLEALIGNAPWWVELAPRLVGGGS